jgi:hypothetical protein
MATLLSENVARQLGGSNRQFVTRVPRSQKKPRQVLALVWDRVPQRF